MQETDHTPCDETTRNQDPQAAAVSAQPTNPETTQPTAPDTPPPPAQETPQPEKKTRIPLQGGDDAVLAYFDNAISGFRTASVLIDGVHVGHVAFEEPNLSELPAAFGSPVIAWAADFGPIRGEAATLIFRRAEARERGVSIVTGLGEHFLGIATDLPAKEATEVIGEINLNPHFAGHLHLVLVRSDQRRELLVPVSADGREQPNAQDIAAANGAFGNGRLHIARENFNYTQQGD